MRDLPADVRKELDIHLVKRVSEVLPLVLSEPLAIPPESIPPPPTEPSLPSMP